jgi:hypothetical protein
MTGTRTATRSVGAVAGFAAALPVTVMAVLEFGYVAGGGDPGWFGFARSIGVITAVMAAAMILAAILVARGHASGALVIALYGAGMALLLGGGGTATGNALAAFHAAISVLELAIAYRLTRGHAPTEGP